MAFRFGGLIATLAGAAGGAAMAQDLCGPLAATPALPRTTILSATSVAADAARRVPAHCEVQAEITPATGSTIGAVYRLPSSWNGKVLGLGGGGFAGNVRADAAADGLARGYAVIQNDMGHPSASALDPSFAFDAEGQRNVEGIVDFGHRATHFATVIGKEVADEALRPSARARVLARLLDGRPARARGSATLSRRLRRRDRRRPVYTPVTYANAMLQSADVPRATREQPRPRARAADPRRSTRGVRHDRRRRRRHSDRPANLRVGSCRAAMRRLRRARRARAAYRRHRSKRCAARTAACAWATAASPRCR